LGVSITPTRTGIYDINPITKFYYYIETIEKRSPGIILPSNYDYTQAYNFGDTVGISNTYKFDLYSNDIRFHVQLSNSLYGPIEQTCNAYTGPQCNVDVPTITNFAATINCNSGTITFNVGLPATNLGQLTWNIYSGGSALYFPNYNGSYNDIVTRNVPNGEASNYYYTKTYSLIASNTLADFVAKSSNSDFTTGGPPLPSNFTITLSNNSNLGVFITVNNNQTGLPNYNRFYYSVSNTSNDKRSGGTACNVLREEGTEYKEGADRYRSR
jgi:hypothetical protein